MKKVIIESPYAGDVERNIKYARLCVKDSLMRGEAPIASHLLYTQEGVLNDDNPNESAMGIFAGIAWQEAADCIAVYGDYGITKGMAIAIEEAQKKGMVIDYRSII